MAKTTTKETKAGKSGKGERERLPKLDLAVLGRDKSAEIKLIEHVMTTESDYGSSELFEVLCKGEKYSWFIRRRSGNYSVLKRRFGRDPVRWEGKTITVVESEFETGEGKTVAFLMIDDRD